MSKVYIIILNYNGWQDTIECLESIMHSDYSNYQIIVVDNASQNNSLSNIQLWLEGRKQAQVGNKVLLDLSCPHYPKPIDFVIYNECTSLKGGGGRAEKELGLNNPIILIQSGENRGFSAGNNVGIQYAMEKSDADFLWLLNNDTVIMPNALHELVNKANEYNNKNERVGIIGSKLLYYYSPELIQGVGGIYNKWFATTKQLGAFEHDNGQYNNDEEVVELIDYPIGASMFVQVKFIEDVGLLCEDYFLYFEEIDWVTRGRTKGWEIGYSGKAIIYHKEGASIGSSTTSEKRSVLSDYCGIKNRVVFTRKFYPIRIGIVYIGILISIVNRIKRKQFNRVGLVIKAMLVRPLEK